jgi:4-diphosphocytidyl-2-C-methyl-D-erythritol kinase
MIIVSAPAKVNLSLRILGKRPDGYHALESVMQSLFLADTLTITEANSFSFTCSDPALETDDNLVVRAAALLVAKSNHACGAHIHLVKRIPAQAGLGGGSSDAATTLATLNAFWALHLPLEELSALAASLGSDVPFFLYAPCAVARGRGEGVLPVVHQTFGYIVLVKPLAGLATSRVYARLHVGLIPVDISPLYAPETSAMVSALISGSLDAVAAATCNDLEDSAFTFLPELSSIRERMLKAGCMAVRLCGSGSALFGICGSADLAHSVADTMTSESLWTWAGEWLLCR